MFKKIILAFFGSLMLVLLIFIGSLYYGIKIDHFENKNVNFDSLYIKYNKKLIVSIDKLEILTPNDDTSSDIDLSALIYLNKIIDNIESINIKNIIYNNEHISLKLKNKQFQINHKEAMLNFNLKLVNKNLVVKSQLFIKKAKTMLNSNLTLNIFTKSLSYTINSSNIKDIKFIKEYVKLEDNINNLITNQLTFDFIKIDKINGDINIEELTNFDIKDITAEATIKNLSFKYEDKPKLLIKDINIKLSNNKININTIKSNMQNMLTLDSKITSSIDGKNITFDGIIYYKDLNLKYTVKINHDNLDYQISTNKFNDLKIFEDFIEIPASIKTWAITRLKTNKVQIDNITGKVNLKDFNVDFNSLRINAKLYNIVMDFNPTKAFPLKATMITLNFDGKDLKIKLTNPISNDVNLKGSKAIVYDMFGSSGLLLKLKTISPLNQTLVRAVQSYDVELPNTLKLKQTKGNSNINVNIDIPFDDKPVDIFVDIKNKNSTFSIKDNNIDFDKFHFLFKDNIVLINNTNAIYKENNINIKNMNFDTNTMQLDLNLDTYDQNNSYFVTLNNQTNLEHNTTKGKIVIDKIKSKDLNKVIINFNSKNLTKFHTNIKVDMPILEILHQNKKIDNID